MRMSLKTHKAYSEIQLSTKPDTTQVSWVARIISVEGVVLERHDGIAADKGKAKVEAIERVDSVEANYRRK